MTSVYLAMIEAICSSSQSGRTRIAIHKYASFLPPPGYCGPLRGSNRRLCSRRSTGAKTIIVIRISKTRAGRSSSIFCYLHPLLEPRGNLPLSMNITRSKGSRPHRARRQHFHRSLPHAWRFLKPHHIPCPKGGLAACPPDLLAWKDYPPMRSSTAGISTWYMPNRIPTR